MILYHGTSEYNRQALLYGTPNGRKRVYGKDKRASFCTTTDIKEAMLFALRKTPISDLSKTGVVIEFDASNLEDSESKAVVDYRASLRKEHEIAVFRPEKLKAVAWWYFESGNWIRKAKTERRNYG